MQTPKEVGDMIAARLSEAQVRVAAAEKARDDALAQAKTAHDENIALTAMLAAKTTRIEELERDVAAARLESRQSAIEAGRIVAHHEAAVANSRNIIGQMRPRDTQKALNAVADAAAPELALAALAEATEPPPFREAAE